ncbi:uncharacterized protein LOC123205130 isoform X3 [Mangifera indica]|uniref:uncharacterized protein LOC123205130 isoform X3 n=1 Tax=Mangifera indica TaxID=29780 RepID=UPI001CF9460C|nr:uncharacterized protein LOC123205130 isoform X3 [Mangifera indica]
MSCLYLMFCSICCCYMCEIFMAMVVITANFWQRTKNNPSNRSCFNCLGTSQVLELDIFGDTMVGDEMRRGISGGQKRRLSTAADAYLLGVSFLGGYRQYDSSEVCSSNRLHGFS